MFNGEQRHSLFDLLQFALLRSDVVLQRGDQVLLREQQVRHVTCEKETTAHTRSAAPPRYDTERLNSPMEVKKS